MIDDYQHDHDSQTEREHYELEMLGEDEGDTSCCPECGEWNMGGILDCDCNDDD